MAIQFSDMHLEKIASLSTDQLAYLAGIFDGEGCVRLHVSKSGTSVKVHIVTTNKALMLWLQNTTGFGSTHTYPAKNPAHRTSYHWICASRQALAFIEAIRPWLIIKAPEVDLLLEYAKLEKADGARAGLRLTPERIERRKATVIKLAELKRAV